MRPFIVGAVALVSAVALSACANGAPTGESAPSPDADQPPATSLTAPAAPTPARTPAVPSKVNPATGGGTANPPASDLSQLERLGIDLYEGVLIDVADDGLERYLQIGRNGVDFTGTTKTDSTMMALKAAPVRERNRVLITPPFWNEEVGPGYCVADTAGASLTLEVCEAGRAAQVWTVVPGGDSGQFELHGSYDVVRVENGRITTDGTGRVGLQTIPFAS